MLSAADRLRPSPPVEPPAAAGAPGRLGVVASARVVKNSVWLVAQPLVLNAVSIFATAYIARTLGPEDYGHFVFALSFIMMFSPLTNMGLRFIATRDLATSARADAGTYVSRISTLRLVLALAAAGACVGVATLRGYAPDATQTVYLASAIIVLQAITTTTTDVFLAFEDARLVAKVQFVSGLVLTIASVVTLFLGLGLVGLMGSYVLGNGVGAVFGGYHLVRRYPGVRVAIDLRFWRTSLVRAAPLFVPVLVLQAGTRLGVVILAALAGQGAVGSYGAASALVEKLSIIPDGVCTSLFPALAGVYERSREEASVLYRKIFRYFLLLALPIAVGTTILADGIIRLMYGDAYGRSATILVVLSWGMFASFFAQLTGWTVGAIGQERKGFIVPIAATAAYLVVAIAFIPSGAGIALAVAGMILAVVSFLMNGAIVRAHLTREALDVENAARVVLAAAIMAAVTLAFRRAPVLLSIALGAVTYAVALVAVGAVRRSELADALGAVRSRLRARTGGAA